MRDLLARFKSIQAAAGAHPTEQTALALDDSSGPLNPVEARPSWPRDEILSALKRGASGEALTLSLQAVSALANDPAFGSEAVALARPVQPGEEWKRAFKTYQRYAQRVIDTGRAGNAEEACKLFADAAKEVSEIYSCVTPFDPMAEQLAMAVYEALTQLYHQNSDV